MAFLYTSQQLAGGARYGSKVKIGNWNEERSRVEMEAKDYELRKARGQLATTHKAQQRIIGMQTVPHSYAGDGLLRFGMSIMLKITTTNPDESTSDHFLANNIWDRVNFEKNTICVTAAPHAAPVARNTFVLARPYAKSGSASGAVYGYGGASGAGDDVLCYGDRFFLASNPSLRVDERTGMVAAPYLLMSEQSNALVGSGKGKQKQDCVMTLKPGAHAEWKVVAASGDELATEGTPVKAGDAIMLVHCVTNHALAATGTEVQGTDFGPELDPHVFTYKTSGLVGAGRLRAAMPPNRWSFVLADSEAAAVDDRGFKPLSAEALLDRVRAIINKRGHHAIRGLGRSFRIMDDRRDGKLDREDFKWGLYDYGVHLTDEEFDIVLDAFDRDDDGTINFTEFLVTLRGPMNDRRLTFVHEAYRRLDKDGSGLVTVSDLAGAYDTSFHPQVQAGKMTHEEAIAEFMVQWDTIERDGVVTVAEFEEYYRDVSASIDDDDYFELMMRNAWHISGGEGWTENTTCRRVLVIHSDGSQEVLEIKDDLGVKDDDFDEMRRRLEAQGVEDIASIELAH